MVGGGDRRSPPRLRSGGGRGGSCGGRSDEGLRSVNGIGGSVGSSRADEVRMTGSAVVDEDPALIVSGVSNGKSPLLHHDVEVAVTHGQSARFLGSVGDGEMDLDNSMHATVHAIRNDGQEDVDGSSMELNGDGVCQAGLLHVATKDADGCDDEQMVESGLLHGVSHLFAGFVSKSGNDASSMAEGNDMGIGNCLPVNALTTSPFLSADFCMGGGSAHGVFQASPVVARTRLHGVRPLASSTGKQQVLPSHEKDGLLNNRDSLGNVWKRPKVIPMPTITELGQFSKNGTTTILDEVEVNANVIKFDSTLVG